MRRINSNDGLFHDGDPFNGITGTMVTAGWLNSMQEELVSVILAAGFPLDPAQTDQLLEAIQKLISDYVAFALAIAMSTAGAPRYIEADANVTPGSYDVNTEARVILATLPANPTKGDSITFQDVRGMWGVHALTIARNGKKIMGLAENLTVDVADLQFTIWYNGTDWSLA